MIENSPEAEMELDKKASRELEDGLFKRMALERRFFLNKSNTKWLSIGVVPAMNGNFTAVARLYDVKGFYMSLTKRQFEHLFKLLRHIPELSSILDKSNSPLKPIQNFYFVKTGFNDTCVYTLKNINSEDQKEMALGIVTLERLLMLEHALRKAYDTTFVDSSLTATAILEKIVRSNDDTMSVQDESVFKAKIKEYISTVCKFSPVKLLAPLPHNHRCDTVYQAILDMASNFSEFIANHLIYERRLSERDHLYETLSDKILDEKHN